MGIILGPASTAGTSNMALSCNRITRQAAVMTPTGTGTRLTYASLTDFGGKVLAALARRSLSSAAISSVRKVVAGASGLALPRGIGD